MNLDKYHKIINDTPKETVERIQLSMEILDRLNYLLDVKFGGNQKLLADKMGKTVPEISQLLSGVQDYSTEVLVQLQLAFGEPVISVNENIKIEMTANEGALQTNR